MLLKLVILATSEGYKPSSSIDKQTRLNTPYIWIYGGDTPTYRTIINFKNEHADLLKNMLAIVLCC
jgi:hypothetical protein